MRACGCWARRIFAYAMRGRTRSSAKRVSPVTFAQASTLGSRCPTTEKGWLAAASHRRGSRRARPSGRRRARPRRGSSCTPCSGRGCRPGRPGSRRDPGAGVAASSASAVRRMPGVQYPHCAAPSSAKACWSGWRRPPSASPSTVRIAASWHSTASARHERTGWPSTSTVHVPHSPSSQPCLVPGSPRSSRSTSRRVRWTGTATSRRSPFTVRAMRLRIARLRDRCIQAVMNLINTY